METKYLQKAVIEALQSPEVLSAFSKIFHSKNESEPSKPISRKESAEFLNVSVQTLDNLAKDGELNPIKFGRRVVYRVEDLENFLNKKRTEK